MPGLLKQLQKHRSAAISDVLVTSPEREEPSIDLSHQDGEALSARHLLQDIIGAIPESGVILRGGGAPFDTDGWGSTESRLIRRRRKSQEEGDSKAQELPLWLREKKTNPQVECIVPVALRMLEEIQPKQAEAGMDLHDAVHKAVNLASRSLSVEMRISKRDREHAEKELLSLLIGKGPLQQLFEDASVTEIFIDSYSSIHAIRRGETTATPLSFRSSEEYKFFIASMLQSVGRTLSLSSPIVDCMLEDQWHSHINAIDSSIVSGDEPRVAIRIPRLQQISFYDVLQTKTLPASLAAWLTEVVSAGQANILVLGSGGSGKTIMTTALLSSVGADERIVTVEEVPEIFVPTSRLEKLLCRPANAKGEGEVKLPELVKAALRRAAQRIVVGEICDEEARLFLRALETGHAGSMATMHADSVVDGLWRLLDVVAAYEHAPQESIMRRISRSLHLVILMRKIDGKPCLYELCEVGPPVNGDFAVLPLARYEGSATGRRQWKLQSRTSHWIEQMRQRGVVLRSGPNLLPPDGGEEDARG